MSFRTGSGLSFHVLPSRGMDISYVEYKGIPLVWRSPTGETAPQFYSSQNWDWLRGFYGGLLVTCGMSNVGSPCVDQGAYLDSELFGAHGRISNIPARNVNFITEWVGEEYFLRIKGEIREATAQGENFCLVRQIKTKLGSTDISVEDVVTNMSYYRVAHMFLYHINCGFPLLDETSELVISVRDIEPLSQVSQEKQAELYSFSSPKPEYPELTYIIDVKPDEQGFCHIGLVNKKFNHGQGIGLVLIYPKISFPYLTLWKRLRRGEYVLGFEPGNCTVQGRKEQQKRGDLVYLNPGEVARYQICFRILGSLEEICEFEKQAQ